MLCFNCLCDRGEIRTEWYTNYILVFCAVCLTSLFTSHSLLFTHYIIFETSVTNRSFFKNYPQPDDHTMRRGSKSENGFDLWKRNWKTKLQNLRISISLKTISDRTTEQTVDSVNRQPLNIYSEPVFILIRNVEAYQLISLHYDNIELSPPSFCIG